MQSTWSHIWYSDQHIFNYVYLRALEIISILAAKQRIEQWRLALVSTGPTLCGLLSEICLRRLPIVRAYQTRVASCKASCWARCSGTAFLGGCWTLSLWVSMPDHVPSLLEKITSEAVIMAEDWWSSQTPQGTAR